MAKYLNNCWYVAAFAHEVSREPLARTLLDLPLVLYRSEDGEPIILADRCPHRFAPLSLGHVVGNDIECGYHGLRIGRTGQCTHNPHSKAVPSAVRISTYPAVDRHGFVWFWPGDREKANPDLIHDFSFLDDMSGNAVVRGYIHARCNYQLVVDNLLDLSHAPFLHPQFLPPESSPEEMLGATAFRFEQNERSVFAYRLIADMPAPKSRQEAFGLDNDPADTRLHMTWLPPSLLDFDSGICPKGRLESEGLCTPAAHCITPETAVTSHYFHATARNRRVDDRAFDAVHLSYLEGAFIAQDEPMLAAVQERMGETDELFGLRPMLLQVDAPAVAARRLLLKLIEEEDHELAAVKD